MGLLEISFDIFIQNILKGNVGANYDKVCTRIVENKTQFKSEQTLEALDFQLPQITVR